MIRFTKNIGMFFFLCLPVFFAYSEQVGNEHLERLSLGSECLDLTPSVEMDGSLTLFCRNLSLDWNSKPCLVYSFYQNGVDIPRFHTNGSLIDEPKTWEETHCFLKDLQTNKNIFHVQKANQTKCQKKLRNFYTNQNKKGLKCSSFEEIFYAPLKIGSEGGN